MKQLSDKFIRLTLGLIIRMICLAPLWVLDWAARIVSRIRVASRGREASWFHANLENVLKLPPHSGFARRFMRQVYYHQVVSAMETIRCIEKPELARWDGLYDFQKKLLSCEDSAESVKKGQILITGHVGCWELVGAWAARLSQNSFHALAKPARNKALTEVLDQLRVRMGIRVLWTGQKTIQRQMLRALAAGDWLGFVMDQKPVGRVGPSVDFFGNQAEFVAGPAQMAIRGGLPVIAVFCLRLGPMHFRLLCREVAPAGHGITDRDEMTRLMAAEIEDVIRCYPEQWCWNYKRWRFDS